MGLYFTVYIFLWIFFIIGTFCCKHQGKTNVLLYKISLWTLLLMLVFRYGQGTDYFAYERIYMQAEFSTKYFSEMVHTEIGWKIMNAFLHGLGMTFGQFIFFFSLVEIVLINNFISRYCNKNRNLAILLLYPMIYLTFMFSMLRQGMCICIFVGILLQLIEEKNWLLYILVVLLCCSLHYVSMLFFIHPFLYKVQKKYLYIWIIVTIAMGFLFCDNNIRMYLTNRLPLELRYYLLRSNVYVPILTYIKKMITTGCFILVYIKSRKKTAFEDVLFKIYFFGIGIHLLTITQSIVSVRLLHIYIALEIYFIINFVTKKEWYILILVLYFNLHTYNNNIEAYITQGNYKENINIINYPYINTYNKEKIKQFRYYY